MPKRIIELSDAQVRTAKPVVKRNINWRMVTVYIRSLQKRMENCGALIIVTAGKLKTASFGIYPQISLSDARKLRDDAKKMLANDVDLCVNKKAQRQQGRVTEPTASKS